MVTVRITKTKGENIGMPKKKAVYEIVARQPSGAIIEDEMAFNKKAANKIASQIRKMYRRPKTRRATRR